MAPLVPPLFVCLLWLLLPLSELPLGVGYGVHQISLGGQHSCARYFFENGTERLRCWGANTAGYLGIPLDQVPLSTLDTFEELYDVPDLVLPNYGSPSAVRAGHQTTCFQMQNKGGIGCVGNNFLNLIDPFGGAITIYDNAMNAYTNYYAEDQFLATALPAGDAFGDNQIDLGEGDFGFGGLAYQAQHFQVFDPDFVQNKVWTFGGYLGSIWCNDDPGWYPLVISPGLQEVSFWWAQPWGDMDVNWPYNQWIGAWMSTWSDLGSMVDWQGFNYCEHDGCPWGYPIATGTGNYHQGALVNVLYPDGTPLYDKPQIMAWGSNYFAGKGDKWQNEDGRCVSTASLWSVAQCNEYSGKPPCDGTACIDDTRLAYPVWFQPPDTIAAPICCADFEYRKDNALHCIQPAPVVLTNIFVTNHTMWVHSEEGFLFGQGTDNFTNADNVMVSELLIGPNAGHCSKPGLSLDYPNAWCVFNNFTVSGDRHDPQTMRFRSACGGWGHLAAVTFDNELYTWGDNSALATGWPTMYSNGTYRPNATTWDEVFQGQPVPFNVPRWQVADPICTNCVADVACGANHTCATMTVNNVHGHPIIICFGDNYGGKLGFDSGTVGRRADKKRTPTTVSHPPPVSSLNAQPLRLFKDCPDITASCWWATVLDDNCGCSCKNAPCAEGTMDSGSCACSCWDTTCYGDQGSDCMCSCENVKCPGGMHTDDCSCDCSSFPTCDREYEYDYNCNCVPAPAPKRKPPPNLNELLNVQQPV